MRFNFQLRPLGSVAPWHDADGSHAHLGWFGLTDGWYWIEVGPRPVELFRYSQPLVDTWMREYTGASWLEALPHVDYQVARLWEDVLDILPNALDPVPPQLARTLDPNGPWKTWERAATTAVEQALDKQEAWDLLEAAAGWWWARRLDTAYLQAGPRIWCWSDGINVHLQWDNRDLILDGQSAWEADLGQHTAPEIDFLAEVRAFDAHFVARMRDRIALAQAEWARPDVALDPGIDQEQLARSSRLSRCLETIAKREPTRWDEVYRAIARVEALPEFASEHAMRLS
jgi:hypothetical protein